MNLKFLLNVLLLLLCLNAISSDNVVDSLKALLPQLNGISKCQTLVDLSDNTVYSDPNIALSYANDAYNLATDLGVDSLKYDAVQLKGHANIFLGNYDEALQLLQEKHQYNLGLKDSFEIAESLCDIGFVYGYMANYMQSISYHEQALHIRERLNDTAGLPYSLNNIGLIYYKWDKYDDALKYYERAYNYFKQDGLKEEMATVIGNMATTYDRQEKYQKSIELSSEALAVYQDLGYDFRIGLMLANIGIAYYKLNDLEKALKNLSESLTIREKIGDKEGVVHSSLNLGNVYFKRGESYKSIAFFEKGMQMAIAIGDFDNLISLKNNLANVYSSMGNYKMAYANLKEAKLLGDSIFNINAHKQIEELNKKYQTAQKEKENTQLKAENETSKAILRKNRFIQYLSLGIAFLVIIVLITAFQKKQTNLKMQNILGEHKLLRSQMNPHFIFNAIAAIQNYILTHSPREAVNYLSAFAGLMRQILEHSRKEYVDLDEELKWLDNYFVLQKLRYSNQFDYELDVDNVLKTESVLIPPMIAQPFIENAIEHGIKEIEQPGKIWLRYKKRDSMILVEIEDNGIGILKSRKQGLDDHQPFAINATKSRLKVLHKKQKTKLSFEILDKSELLPGSTGTIVRFTLPYIMKF